MAVRLSFVYVELQQRRQAHCLAFPVLGLVSYRMTVITERLVGPLSYRARVTPRTIDACLASQSPRLLEGSVPILQDKCKGKAIPLQALDRPRGFQEVEVPRLQDNRLM